jgi:hypothetical protein
MKIVCVYKTGGDYSIEYVVRLRDAVNRHTSKAHDFLCLTDDSRVAMACDTIPLKHDWWGWWSKIELFRDELPAGQYLYFDLDTIIVDEIDELIEQAALVNFAMLRGFNPSLGGDHPASGIMMGDFQSQFAIYERFVEDPIGWINQMQKNRPNAGMQGDQGYILEQVGWDVPKIQDFVPEDYIVGKRHTLGPHSLRKNGTHGNVIPAAAHVVAWSGNPRLHTIKTGPIAEQWRQI